MEPAAPDVRADARWHLYDIRPEARRFTLIRLDEDSYRSASFLDERVTGQAREGYRFAFERRDELLPAAGDAARAPLFIFHVGHCGSTLLSRALSAHEDVLPVREPLTLRTLADARRDLPHPWRPFSEDGWRAWLQAALGAHARGFHPRQRALVKATSQCNNLVRPVLACDRRARAVLLYVRLETYIAGMLKREEPPADLLGFARARIMDWEALAGDPPFSLDALTRPELAALAWMSAMQQLLDASAAHPERTLLLDFDAFLAAPDERLPEVAAFCGLDAATPALLGAYPALASRYAKDPAHPYSARRRQQVLAAVAARDGDAIRAGLEWARARGAEAPAFEACLAYASAAGA
jgi:hypothetical protein